MTRDIISGILNSSFVNGLIRWGMTKTGIAASAIAAWIMAWLLSNTPLPNLLALGMFTADQVTAAITGIALAIMGSFFAWIAQRQKDGVKLMQSAINVSDTPIKINVDGIAVTAPLLLPFEWQMFRYTM